MSNASQAAPLERLLVSLPELLPVLEAAYKDIHAHPELSMQESCTAGIAARHLTDNGYDVTTGVGKTGVVGMLRNGDGPTVMLRADMDALPIREDTGLDYGSTATAADASGKAVPVAHSCGHDMHVAWLMGASALFARNRDAWKGTLIALFQPGEETAQGARAMIDDGLFTRFPRPDICSASTSWSGRRVRWREVPGRSHRRRTASRSVCSDAARMDRCRRPASIRS